MSKTTFPRRSVGGGKYCYSGPNCKKHPITSITTQAVKTKDVGAYFAAREAEDLKKNADRIQRDIVLRVINSSLDNLDWGDYVPKVRALITRLTVERGTPSIGRTRAVFDMGNGYVMKVPFTDEGELSNWREDKTSKTEDAYVPVAECYYDKIDGVDVLMMEKVKMVDVDYNKMPDWVYSVDCGQVGLNRKGDLVAYDL